MPVEGDLKSIVAHQNSNRVSDGIAIYVGLGVRNAEKGITVLDGGNGNIRSNEDIVAWSGEHSLRDTDELQVVGMASDQAASNPIIQINAAVELEMWEVVDK